MAQWKKVVFSGSAAELSSLTLTTPLAVAYGGTGTSSIGTNNFLVGNGAASYTHIGSNGTGTVVRTSNASAVIMSGSFSGSYVGNGAGLTGVLADSSFPIAGASGSSATFATATDTLMFTTASNHGFTFQVLDTGTAVLAQLSTPQDLQTTANVTFGDVAVNGGDLTTNQTTFNLLSATATTINFGNNAATTINVGKGNTVINLSGSVNVLTSITASTAMLTGLTGQTTDTVLVLSSTTVGTRAIDTRVWGTSLIDGSGATTRVAYFSDADTLTSDANFTYNGTVMTINGSTFGANTRIAGNLIIAGTASFEHANSLLVSDRFVLFNSGSATGDGGFIVQSGSSAMGSAIVWDDSAGRFGLQIATPLSASAIIAVPDAYLSAVVDVDGGLSNIATYQKNGNIRVESGEVFIYA